MSQKDIDSIWKAIDDLRRDQRRVMIILAAVLPIALVERGAYWVGQLF